MPIKGAVAGTCSKFRKNNSINNVLIITVCLFFAVYLLKYAVGYYSSLNGLQNHYALTAIEELFSTLYRTLRTFSLDDEFVEYIQNVKLLAADLFKGEKFLGELFGIYTGFLTFVSPLASGFLIFEVLSGLFPKLKLKLSGLAFWKEKIFFSELNSASVILAESIKNAKHTLFCKPVIIFTDVYTDRGEEKSSELLSEAIFNGFICVRDDIAHVPKNLPGKKIYYLIKEDETKNLQALADLAEKNNHKYVKNSKIYVFTQSDMYIKTERLFLDKLQKAYNVSGDKANSVLPVVFPINCYRNLAANLFVDLPLYEPIINKKRESDGSVVLNLAILGIGKIGTELFLSAYWMGQMLDCKLNITVVAKEPENDFRQKIDSINPEILETTEVGKSILQYRDGVYNDPYVTVKYINADLKSDSFGSDNCKAIINSDYIVVALGSDENNLAIAENLHKAVGGAHIDNDSVVSTVIAYVVYDSDLSEILNRKKYYSSVDKSRPDICMYAFGGLNDIYSLENIQMTRYSLQAKETGNAYNHLGQASTEDFVSDNKKRRKNESNDYGYWANLARAMHLKYKVYSLGWITTSVFDSVSEDKSMHKAKVAETCAQYKRIAIHLGYSSDADRIEELEDKKHLIAWLEHRRWNAFTRTKGFKSTKAYCKYFDAVGGSYKHMELKLHPCLVECDKSGIKASFLPDGMIDESTELKCTNRSTFDYLDELSYDLYERGYNNYDFKKYDYPRYEFDEFHPLSVFAEKTGLSIVRAKELCESGAVAGAFRHRDEQVWYVPHGSLSKKYK